MPVSINLIQVTGPRACERAREQRARCGNVLYIFGIPTEHGPSEIQTKHNCVERRTRGAENNQSIRLCLMMALTTRILFGAENYRVFFPPVFSLQTRLFQRALGNRTTGPPCPRSSARPCSLPSVRVDTVVTITTRIVRARTKRNI